MDTVFFVGLVTAGLRLATPMIYAALGETLAQRSGVLNIGIEGVMVMGAFTAAVGAVWTGSPWVGLAFAILVGGALGAGHAFFCITLRVDQIVAGVGMIVLCLGLSGFAFRLTLGAERMPPPVPTFSRLEFGGLSQVEIVGPILFNHHLLVYLGIAAAFVLAWLVQRTTWGLEVRAIGEAPEAADSVGVPVNRLRYLAIIAGGAFAGVGGAYLTVAQLGSFVDNMVAGRGFIAVACVVFGRWHPVGVMAAALFFGLADSAQIRLQTLNPDIPYQFFVMMPYALAIVALVVFAGRGGLPRALGIPFTGSRG
jgi:simple sugar transport system permease protein